MPENLQTWTNRTPQNFYPSGTDEKLNPRDMEGFGQGDGARARKLPVIFLNPILKPCHKIIFHFHRWGSCWATQTAEPQGHGLLEALRLPLLWAETSPCPAWALLCCRRTMTLPSAEHVSCRHPIPSLSFTAVQFPFSRHRALKFLKDYRYHLGNGFH